MPKVIISLQFQIEWKRPVAANGNPFNWGDDKKYSKDKSWLCRCILYGWVRNSDKKVAYIGETDRSLSDRVNNYISAQPGSEAGRTNKMVYAEQQKLHQIGDCMFLEFCDDVPGFDLNVEKQRKAAEGLLIGYYKPYLQF